MEFKLGGEGGPILNDTSNYISTKYGEHSEGKGLGALGIMRI